jgi:hypothetical protein
MFANLEIHTLEEEMSNTFAIMINNESSMRICFIQYITEFSSLCFHFEKYISTLFQVLCTCLILFLNPHRGPLYIETKTVES